MDLEKVATAIFGIFVTIATVAILMLLLMCECGEGSINEDPKYSEPVEVVEPLPVATTDEETEVVATESEVVMLSCTVIKKADTTQSEAAQPVNLYNVPLEADLQRFIISKAEEIGIDPAVIFAMAYKESTYTPASIGDEGNAFGLLQIWPKWNMERMKRLGCMDLLDPFQNVTVAADLLGELMGKYGDIAVALTVYNFGHYPGYITGYATDVLNTAEGLTKAVSE